MKTRGAITIRFVNFTALSAFVFVLLLGLLPGAATTEFPTPELRETSSGPHCDVKGSTELTITCDYSPVPNDFAKAAQSRIALDHASFSFDTYGVFGGTGHDDCRIPPKLRHGKNLISARSLKQTKTG